MSKKFCFKCKEGYLIDGTCENCGFVMSNSSKQREPDREEVNIMIGSCDFCGGRGKKIGDRFICLACRVTPIREGVRCPRPTAFYSCREEAMYYRAKHLYYDEPKYLGEPINERIMAIAHDRWVSKGQRVPINPELWAELPYDVK